MPHQTPLRAGDPQQVGNYRVTGRLAGIASDDTILIGIGPDGAEVAISMLGSDWADGPAARDRFAAEAAVAKRVPPFCAARLLDGGVDGSRAYLVREYVRGPSLQELIVAEGVRSGPDLEAVAIGTATGLASVHQAGLVHGHLGPDYVIMADDGSLSVVEFGITPPYGSATPAADMFSWAQTVVYAASGRPAATFGDLQVLPEHLRVLAARCLDPDPVARPAARAVVLTLLGDADPPAGVLAEASRRANRSATQLFGPRLRPTGRSWSTLLGPSPAMGEGSAAPPASQAAPPSQAQPAPVQPLATSALPMTAQTRPGFAASGRAGPAQPVQVDPVPAQAPLVQQLPAQTGSGLTAQAKPRTHRGPARHSQSGASVHHAAAVSSPGSRRAALLIGAFLVLAVVGAAVVVHLMQNSGSPQPAKSDNALDRKPRLAISSSPTPSSAPVPSVVAPAAFAGSWSGRVKQPPADTYKVTVALAEGQAAGTISYSAKGLYCTGALSLTRATSRKLSMRQDITKGSCKDGRVTISLMGSDRITFNFHGNRIVAFGTLRR
jgi:hypothetical protein